MNAGPKYILVLKQRRGSTKDYLWHWISQDEEIDPRSLGGLAYSMDMSMLHAVGAVMPTRTWEVLEPVVPYGGWDDV